MSVKHTPGPWEHVADKEHTGRAVRNAKGHVVAFVRATSTNGLVKHPFIENAALIAAAPTLADALEALLGLLDEMEEPIDEEAAAHIERARAALKAAGR